MPNPLPNRICRTECIILKTLDFGESDRIITLYSPDRGLFTAIAKGAKRSQKRFVNKLEEFSLIDVSYYPAQHHNRLHFLKEAELQEAFLSLRTDWQHYSTAMLACEFVLRFTREHDPDSRIFSLLHWVLHSLHQGASPLPSLVFFLLHLLDACGYRPALDRLNHRCVTCSGSMNSAKNNRERNFSLQHGNRLLCKPCGKNGGNNGHSSGFTLSRQSLRILQTAQNMTGGQMQGLLMPESVAAECLFTLYCYSQQILQCDIHSWNFFCAYLRREKKK